MLKSTDHLLLLNRILPQHRYTKYPRLIIQNLVIYVSKSLECTMSPGLFYLSAESSIDSLYNPSY